MTREDICRIKNSWKLLRAVKPEIIGDVFYSKLFLEWPELMPMFRGDIQVQSRKLISTFNVVIARLDRLDELKDDIRKLAIRHTGYGVKPAHYDMVGTALLWTLKIALGAEWTEAMEQSWSKCYTTLASTMIAASATQSKAA